MKKKNIAALAAFMMLFAACSDKTKEDVPVDTVTSAEETSSVESVTEEDILPDEDEELEIKPQESAEDNAEEDTVSNPLYPIIEKVISESEWPTLSEITDEFVIKEFFLLDPSNENYKEMIIMQCPISAIMSEIIIINAEDPETARTDLEARRTKAIEQDAWYPADKELADASIVDVNGSYAYFIIGTEAAAAEKSINDFINTN